MINPFVYTSINADEYTEADEFVPVFTTPSVSASKAKLPYINAIAALVLDAQSGRVLYEKNGYSRRSMASTTKIMTAILAIEKGNLDDDVVVSKRAASTSGSDISLKTGEKLTLSELLYGLMLASGNDASVAIAEHIGGSVEEFCKMMTAKAIELGCKNTNFITPHGLDKPDHYTTAYEL
ncbi:MAG: D-alanyl-D-alanine carboxypeptidase, partial [Clostridiales bacterium]|nr:D-alanyl-D-alanine carboxypeptidase [Clostridiales bacterium]